MQAFLSALLGHSNNYEVKKNLIDVEGILEISKECFHKFLEDVVNLENQLVIR